MHTAKRILALTAALALAAVPGVFAGDDDDWCREYDNDSRGWHCEVRELMLEPSSRIAVDAAPNGGIRVEGWDRNEVRLQARVAANADTDEEARALVSEVRIDTGGTISADGPRTRGRKGWWVSYRLHVPQVTDLELESSNGGISVAGVSGTIDARTTNGGLSLENLSGDVRGRTTNGGANVRLSGDRWEGEGLDVRTTNGGVTLYVPEGYSARLETGTTNGRTRFDFPVTVSGDLGRRVELDLGSGGAPVRAVTTNGGVRVRRP